MWLFQHSDRSAVDNGPKGTGPRLTVTNPTYGAYCVLGWGGGWFWEAC
jgi:hypothetical protein